MEQSRVPRASATSPDYRLTLFSLVGDQDPRAILRDPTSHLETILAGVSVDEMRLPEAPGKWSILQVLGHLVDTELTYGFRARLILAQDRPPIAGYDQDAFGERLHYNEMDPRQLLETLRMVRRHNLALADRLSDEELDREGLHSERGPESVRMIIRMMAGHDLVHRRQIQRIKDSFTNLA